MLVYYMSLQEQKLKKKVQIIVATCLSVFFILATVAIFQFAIRINQNNQEAALIKHGEFLQEQIEKGKMDIEYFGSKEFLEEHMLRYLNR